MALSSNGTLLRYVRALYDFGTFAGLTDGQLLERFTTRSGEAAELAFAALVERHGPMVLRVCQRVLPDRHDAEDAFQAVFLVLVRRAGSVRNRESVASWLHGVALRVAGAARSAEGRRAVHEQRAASKTVVENERAPDDLGPVLHEEIGRMPDRYRAAVVLCYLEGRTYDEAARLLGCPVGTVKSRLATARETLRARLARRGLAPVAGALSSVLAAEAATAAVPRGLAEAAVQNALRLGAHKVVFAGTVSATITALTEGAVGTMARTKLKLSVAFVLAIGVGGAGVLAQQSSRIANSQSVGGVRSADSVRQDDAQLAGTAVGPPNASDVAIEKKLDEPTSLNTDECPTFASALEFLAERSGLDFVLDPQALRRQGVSEDSKVDLVCHDIRLRSVLTMLLRPLGLNFKADGGKIVVMEFVSDQIWTSTYYVGDLLPDPANRNGRPVWSRVDFDAIVELISSSVAPGTWHINRDDTIAEGGARGDRGQNSSGTVRSGKRRVQWGGVTDDERVGSITPFFLSGSLIIRHTQEVHDRIANLLRLSRCLRYGSDREEKVGPGTAPAVNSATATKSEAPRSDSSMSARTVYVPVPKSTGLPLESKMPFMITELLMKEIERTTSYKVVGSPDEADFVLEWSLAPRAKLTQKTR